MHGGVVPAYAKINLSLSVGKRCKSGYHKIHSLMTEYKCLYDDVEVVAAPPGQINVRSFDANGNPILYCLPTENTAYKAVVAMHEVYPNVGADITITKRIPIGGGMGGASADAAAVIKSLSCLYDIGDKRTLMNICKKIGCDVPFMYVGGTAVVSGYGEVVRPVELQRMPRIMLYTCEKGSKTAEVYREFDRLNPDAELDETRAEKLIEAINKGCKAEVDRYAVNDLAKAALSVNSTMHEQYTSIRDSTIKLHVSGSGSTMFSLHFDA